MENYNMEVNLGKYYKNHCESCKHRKSDKCCFCIKHSDFFSVPSQFEAYSEFETLYFYLLEDYTHMLYSMGFTISK